MYNRHSTRTHSRSRCVDNPFVKVPYLSVGVLCVLFLGDVLTLMFVAWLCSFCCATPLIYASHCQATCSGKISLRCSAAVPCLWENFVDKRVCIVIKRKGFLPEYFNVYVVTCSPCPSMSKSFVINFSFAQRCLARTYTPSTFFLSVCQPFCLCIISIFLVFLQNFSSEDVDFEQRLRLRPECSLMRFVPVAFSQVFRWILISLTANLAH